MGSVGEGVAYCGGSYMGMYKNCFASGGAGSGVVV